MFKVVVPSAKSVEDLWPDFDAIGKFPGKGTIVTGIAPPASGFDFYSRFFAPKFGINEVMSFLLVTPQGLLLACFVPSTNSHLLGCLIL